MATRRSHDPFQVDLLTLQAVADVLPPLLVEDVSAHADLVELDDTLRDVPDATARSVASVASADAVVEAPDAMTAAADTVAPGQPTGAQRSPVLDDAMGSAITQYRTTGDERALAPVMTFFRRRFHYEAQRQARLGGRAAPLDTTDAQSAGFEALVGAINSFEPATGVPFLAYFKQFHRAAMNEERSRLGGLFTMSRKMHQTRVAVLRAAEELRKEQKATEVTGTSQRKFRLPLSLDDARLAVLDHGELAARGEVLKVMRHAVARHFLQQPGWSDTARGTLTLAREAIQAALSESTGSTRTRIEHAIVRALAVPSTHTPFRFSAAFTPTAFDALESVHRAERVGALHTLIQEVDHYLARALPGLKDATRRVVSVQRVDAVRGAGWSTTRQGLEANLQTRLSAFLAQTSRRGLGSVEAMTMERSETRQLFVAEVAHRAGTSKQLASHLLRLDTYGLSLDAPVEGKGGKEAGSLGERLVGERDAAGAERFWRVAQMLAFVPAGPRTLMVLNLGLDGRRRLSKDELREATGFSHAVIDRALELPAQIGRDPLVIAHVDGPEAARVAKEQAAVVAFRDVAQAFLEGRPAVGAVESAVTPSRVRAAVTPVVSSQTSMFDTPPVSVPAFPAALVESP